METQQLFNIIVSVIGAMAAWILKVLWDTINEVKKDVHDFKQDSHHDFVRRDDFADAIKRIETMVNKIFDKLDSKVDK